MFYKLVALVFVFGLSACADKEVAEPCSQIITHDNGNVECIYE